MKPGRYSDGAGLYLVIRSSGHKGWVFRYAMSGRRRDIGLGAFPDVRLSDARISAEKARAQIREGIDPLAAKNVHVEDGDHSFRKAAADLIADRAIGWSNPKHAAQWTSTLEAHVYPVIGDIDVEDITTDHLLDILRPIWAKTPETGSRVRGRIEAIMDGARARGWRTSDNPARWKGHLATRLPPPSRVRATVHHPSLPWQQIPAFFADLRKREGYSARSLEFTILAACRSGEARGMKWSEVDLKKAIWTIPPERMKTRRWHRVPLSDEALQVLTAVRPDNIVLDHHVFAAPGGKPQSLMAMLETVRRMNGKKSGHEPIWKDGLTGEPIVPHGFRSSFRDWASEATPYAREVAEAALAHTVDNKVEAAYARSDLLDLRRPLMDDWGKWCISKL
ncbi:hypothetical protein A0U89_07140 [Kozakia baliensis]|uniref:Tyr recombinase domain-containing protein n=1 Tax=Kozakia baliensis TaxID=153496 RepID=A0A1D8UTH6_9PROT|nr:hypothetical protein A0U89_07140 [Kozakia baliensis]